MNRLSLLAAAGAAATLIACAESAIPTDSEPTDGESYWIGSFTVSADTLVLRTPKDTAWECEGAAKIMSEVALPPQPRRFALAGDELRIFTPPETFTGADGGRATVQFHVLHVRSGGGQGLENHWRVEDKAYNVLSGTLAEASKAKVDRILQAFQAQKQLLTEEIILTGGQAWIRKTGSFSGNFIAGWNGLLAYDPLWTPDSARYDVDVSAQDLVTARLKGNRTGETVTITFTGPLHSQKHYASDNPDHPAYSEDDNTLTCPLQAWYQGFLEENRRLSPVP